MGASFEGVSVRGGFFMGGVPIDEEERAQGVKPHRSGEASVTRTRYLR